MLGYRYRNIFLKHIGRFDFYSFISDLWGI